MKALRTAGWIVLRFTADDVLRRPAQLLAQLVGAVEERRGHLDAGGVNGSA